MQELDWYPEVVLRFSHWDQGIERQLEAHGWNVLVIHPTQRRPERRGFSLTISSAKSFMEQIQDSREFLLHEKEFIKSLLHDRNQQVSIDFTIVKGEEAAYSSILFDVAFLSNLSNIGIELEVGVYW